MHIYLCNRDQIKNGEEAIRGFAMEYAEEMGMSHLQNAIETALIVRNPAGKPCFACISENILGIHFSLSHSGSVWGCAFDLSPLGFDLEDRNRLELNKTPNAEVQRQQRWLKIAQRFFFTEECEYVNAGGEEAFFRLWIRKEAYVKYKGIGLLAGTSRIRFVADGELLSELPDAYAEELTLNGGLMGTYCAAEKRAIDKIIDYR